MSLEKEIDEVWEKVWKPILINELGDVREQQLKKELYDVFRLVRDLQVLYYEVTGGRVQRADVPVAIVLQAYREHKGVLPGRNVVDNHSRYSCH